MEKNKTIGIPKRDGSGKGMRLNYGRGECPLSEKKIEMGENMDKDMTNLKLVEKIKKLDMGGIPKKLLFGGPVKASINNDGNVLPNDKIPMK